jgi:hypothetical protein
MMKTKLALKGLAVFFIFSFFLLACDKEEVTPEFKQMSFESEEVLKKLPSGLVNSSDEHAKECISMINDALDMSEFVGDMVVPSGAVKTSKKSSGDTWTWSVNAQGYEYTFFWTYSEDGSKHYWTMEIQVDGGEKHAYIQAWEYKDGSGGQVKYNFNWTAAVYGSTEYEDIFWTYNWSLDDSGNYHFTMTWDSGEGENEFYLEYIVVINDDGSGSIEYWLMDSLVYEMEWDAAGNGTWAYYSGGEELMSGSWEAA